MATDGVNISEDAEMAECDGDKVVTMMDVLQEQQDFEEDANAVLGASDDKNCTYPKGYIKRQALYACLTCCTEAKIDPAKRAGVCLACSLTCHENHELIELYTKRNFRCDCGNPKFNDNPCQFTPDKIDFNDENVYNQNFSGLYCTCHRPYPDPDSTLEDDMIQCIICEDWLHASHLEAIVPANDQYAEMVCKACMEKNDFLHDYSMFAVNVPTGDVDIITVNGDVKSADNGHCNGDLENLKLVNGVTENKIETEATTVPVNGDVEIEKEKSDDSKNNKINESIAPETNNETKQVESNNIVGTDLIPEATQKQKDVVDKEMDVDTESLKAEEKDQSMAASETNEPGENLDKTSRSSEETNKEKSKDTSEAQLEEKTDTTETPPEVESEQKIVKANDVKSSSTAEKIDDQKDDTKKMDMKNDEMDSTDNGPEKTEEVPVKQIKTQEQNIEQSTNEEKGDGDKAPKNVNDNNEKTEEQLLDDLSTLTANNPISNKNEGKPVESMEQSDDSKTVTDRVQTKNEDLFEDTTNELVESHEDKPATKNENATGEIEVPDTSQSPKSDEDNAVDKTDSVMDAIDELLDTPNEVKQNKVAEENKESTTESTESKDNTENVKAKDSNDVEMCSSETKPNDTVPEKAEETTDSNNKTSTDAEMSYTSSKEPPVSENKVDSKLKVDFDGKDDNDKEASDITSKDETSLHENKDVDEKSEDMETVNESISQGKEALNKTENELLKTADETDTDVTESTSEHKRKLSIDLTEDISSKRAKLDCMRPREMKRIYKGATFWPSNFRQKLCTCGECLSMYKDLKVLFLTDPDDTVSAYESLGKENVAGGASQYEKGMQALSSLDRIQQINALTEYNKMRDKLLDFLKSFKDRKEIVKEEDIKAFFAGMKPRREPDGVYFCR